MNTDVLFQPLQVGPMRLSHRVVMAPLTRMRADPATNAPVPINARYYGQRASDGGLIIAEASQVSQQGKGAPTTPGIHTETQIAGWRGITEAIHARGGKVFLQLWHMGRLSHPSHQPGGGLPVAPSAVGAKGMCTTAQFTREPFPVPRALETDQKSRRRGNFLADSEHRDAL